MPDVIFGTTIKTFLGRQCFFAHQRPLPLVEQHQQALKTHKKTVSIHFTTSVGVQRQIASA